MIQAYADIRELTAAKLIRDLGQLPQVIVGSPPCQDTSSANARGKGVDGERSGLFFEAARLIGECRPVWACLENSPAIRTRGYDRVASRLEREGYACWPLVVGAWHAGAPHRRNRCWLIAADTGSAEWQQQGRNGAGRRIGCTQAAETVGLDVHPAANSGQVGFETERPQGLLQSKLEPGIDAKRRDTGDANEKHIKEYQFSPIGEDRPPQWTPARPNSGLGGHVTEAVPALEPILSQYSAWNGGIEAAGRVDDGFPKGLARKMIAAYGDAVVPQITESIGRVMAGLLGMHGPVLDLFAGAARGWSLGMHRAGYEMAAICEIDDWRREMALKHHASFEAQFA